MSFVLETQSYLRKSGQLRGLHFQSLPRPVALLVRCGQGSAFVVAVDLRVGSPTYGQWHGETLSFEVNSKLYIPEGFAHGFLALEDNTEVLCQCTDVLLPDLLVTIRYDDPEIGISWPQMSTHYALSEEDDGAPFLRDISSPFTFEVDA